MQVVEPDNKPEQKVQVVVHVNKTEAKETMTENYDELLQAKPAAEEKNLKYDAGRYAAAEAGR